VRDGPLAEITDDASRVYPRGVRVAVDAATWELVVEHSYNGMKLGEYRGKSAEEIERMERAGALSDVGHEELFLATKVGRLFEIVLFSFVTCIVPTPLVICAVYGRGDVRAFSIGALNPWVVSIALRFPDPYGTFFEMIWLIVMGGICGVLAVVTRRWIWRDQA
jgi:hypothetical protein